MDNNKFNKMLFENNNQFKKQFKGIKPLNEDFTGKHKPKISSKKQLGTIKEVQINDCMMSLIIDISGYKIVILHHNDKSMLKNGLVSPILNSIEGSDYTYWHVEADYDKSELLEEVIYCIDNFDEIMK